VLLAVTLTVSWHQCPYNTRALLSHVKIGLSLRFATELQELLKHVHLMGLEGAGMAFGKQEDAHEFLNRLLTVLIEHYVKAAGGAKVCMRLHVAQPRVHIQVGSFTLSVWQRS
jgi:hypothetical protein